MKTFQISEAQISKVIGAASADELSRRFNRHFDFLTIASWSQETELGRIAIGDEEQRACVDRASEFFGIDPALLSYQSAMKISDWSEGIAAHVQNGLLEFCFKSAARDEQSASHRHPASHIFQDAAAAANLFYGRRRLLSFVAPHSLLGFELTVLTPNLLDIESIDARGMTPDALSRHLLFGDVLIATPTLWRYMMRENLTAPDNTMAVSFGEPMTSDLAAQMRKSGFGVLRELYGSTETGLIAWRDAPGEDFVIFDHWRRDGDNLVRTAPDARSKVIAPMDILAWSGDRGFSLDGRRDGAVQIGAINVFPKEVAQALKGHAKIADCVIKVGRGKNGANRLIAHIVLSNAVSPNEQTAREIDSWCRQRLRQQERPRIYNFEAAL